jgi:hypothetical protein
MTVAFLLNGFDEGESSTESPGQAAQCPIEQPRVPVGQ